MPDMLIVPTFKLGHPMALAILVIAYYLPLHKRNLTLGTRADL